MGDHVQSVISHNGRHIICGIKGSVRYDTREDQHGQETRSLILPEDIGNGNHQGQ
jgi:hypothetical protein